MAALTVTATLPWPAEIFDLDDPLRLSGVHSLLRPSIKAVPMPGSHDILLDTSVAEGKVGVAIIGPPATVAAHFRLQGSVAAIVSEDEKAGSLSTARLLALLKDNGLALEHGLVVLRLGREKSVRYVKGDVVEVTVDSELGFNHAISLLESASDDTKQSIGRAGNLLDDFVGNSKSARTTIKPTLVGDKAFLVHEDGEAVFESARQSIRRDLELLMKAFGFDKRVKVYSAHLADLNGLSKMENWLLVNEMFLYFREQGTKCLISSSTIHELGTKNWGWTISLCAVSNGAIVVPEQTLEEVEEAEEVVKSASGVTSISKMQFDDSRVRAKIEAGCSTVIKAEPEITVYDTIVGDGDCGMTLRDGAQKVLDFIEDKDLSNLPDTVAALVDDLEVTMGGTSGALYCIFLSALSQHLRVARSVAEALSGACDELCKYTKARVGDRTVMDCLIPFVTTLSGDGNLEAALAAAKGGVDSTGDLKASLGRSTYLDESATKGVPDPGAYGLLVLLEGMCKAELGDMRLGRVHA